MALLRKGASRASNCTLRPVIRPLSIHTPVYGHRHKSTTVNEKPPFNPSQPITYTQLPNPKWKPGDGAIDNKTKKYITINPSDPARPPSKNYKFLVSSIAPRPIALISTLSPAGKNSTDGKLKLNLAPFSYFQVINHDPPMFVVSFTPPGSRSPKSQKDTLRNLTETRQCVINVVSEHMLQAANATTINAAYGDSEFDYSGLTPAYDTETVNGVPRVLESIVSIEGHLIETKEFESRATASSDPKKEKGKTTLAIVEGTRFWVREDAIDATELAAVDLQVLRPVSRLGGEAYGRTTEVVEIERPVYRS